MPSDPISLKKNRVLRFLCKGIGHAAALWAATAVGMGLRAAEPSSGAENKEEYHNSLGMAFHEVHGAAVKFSIWETRVSDWRAYLSGTHQSWNYWPPFKQADDHPVVNVTMPEAQAFCEWLTNKEHAAGLLKEASHYRLPTNVEWDVAVGVREASATLQFPWGTAWPPPPDAGNYNSARIEGAKDDGFPFTSPVGKFRASPDGLYDLGGNAWEWTVTLSAAGGGPKSTLRGASWMYWRKECLASSYVLPSAPNMRAPSIGFRCVLENAADSKREHQLYIAEENAQVHGLLDQPKISPEELKKASAELLGGSTDGSEKKRTAETPEASPGHVFINSEGIKMIPLPGRNMLLAEQELRIQDFRPFTLSSGSNWKQSAAETDDEPVTRVTWTDAVDFCLWLTRRERDLRLIPARAMYRLPKLEEWVAATGQNSKTPTLFPWGNAWPPPDKFANLGIAPPASAQSKGPAAALKAVKSFSPGPLGFYDLTGNVAEWCVEVNADAPTERTYCGGSWQSAAPEELRNSGVKKAAASASFPDVGFRLALQFRATDATFQESP